MTNDEVKNPKHYFHPSGIEVIDITRYESFLRGNIIKYVLRAPYKGNELQDLKKAAQYLEWEIERIERGLAIEEMVGELSEVSLDTDSLGALEEDG